MVRWRQAAGFTLLEVLVALAVLAIALAALVKGVGDNAANAAYLRDKSLAHWVGMNVVADYRLAEKSGTGSKRGEEEMANHTWYWTATLSETFDEDVRRLDVTVRGEERKDAPSLVALVAFLPRPKDAGKAP